MGKRARDSRTSVERACDAVGQARTTSESDIVLQSIVLYDLPGQGEQNTFTLAFWHCTLSEGTMGFIFLRRASQLAAKLRTSHAKALSSITRGDTCQNLKMKFQAPPHYFFCSTHFRFCQFLEIPIFVTRHDSEFGPFARSG